MWRLGLRISEALALEWRDIVLASRTVIVRRSKSRHPRTMPLQDDLSRLFSNWPASRAPRSKVVNPWTRPDRGWARSKGVMAGSPFGWFGVSRASSGGGDQGYRAFLDVQRIPARRGRRWTVGLDLHESPQGAFPRVRVECSRMAWSCPACGGLPTCLDVGDDSVTLDERNDVGATSRLVGRTDGVVLGTAIKDGLVVGGNNVNLLRYRSVEYAGIVSLRRQCT